jgi:transient receptor potential cation channel subfamily M protein 2
VHYKTPTAKITQLLRNYWHLKEPKLLISVTGGAQKFSLKQRLEDVFRRGLVKAAHSTGAWISTGGFNVGVMKHVGEAIAENSSSFGRKDKIVVLGIATWDMTLNQEILINNSQVNNKKYFLHNYDS